MHTSTARGLARCCCCCSRLFSHRAFANSSSVCVRGGTEDDDVVEAYNRHVDRLPGVDITDDYVSEKREVEAHGKRLSYYKWMAKAVLGGKMPKYDHMDEKKGAGGGGCCLVS